METLIKPSDLDLIRHALGVASNVRRSNWGYRNRFCCGESDKPAMERLAANELVIVRGKPSELTGGYQSYTVTEKGCDMIGLTPAQKKRAFER